MMSNLQIARGVMRGECCVVCERCGGSGLIVITNTGEELPYWSAASEIVKTAPEECVPCVDCVAGAVVREGYLPQRSDAEVERE
jgi:hypothetical protein